MLAAVRVLVGLALLFVALSFGSAARDHGMGWPEAVWGFLPFGAAGAWCIVAAFTGAP